MVKQDAQVLATGVIVGELVELPVTVAERAAEYLRQCADPGAPPSVPALLVGFVLGQPWLVVTALHPSKGHDVTIYVWNVFDGECGSSVCCLLQLLGACGALEKMESREATPLSFHYIPAQQADITGDQAGDLMVRLANDYDKLADRAQVRADDKRAKTLSVRPQTR